MVWPLFLTGVGQVSEVKGDDVVCMIKNSATLAGSLFTLHVSQIHIDLPTLSDKDKEVSTISFYDAIFFLLCIISVPCFMQRKKILSYK